MQELVCAAVVICSLYGSFKLAVPKKKKAVDWKLLIALDSISKELKK